jgi:predicted Fe-S protein YdhL (DUF1289 family)
MDDATGFCKGCYRTIGEIMVWGQASSEVKQSIWQELHQRHHDVNFPEATLNKLFKKADARSA